MTTTSKKLKQIAISSRNYETLKNYGRAGESFDAALSTVLKLAEQAKDAQEAESMKQGETFRCLAPCEECTGAYVSETLGWRWKCGCACHEKAKAEAQKAKAEARPPLVRLLDEIPD